METTAIWDEFSESLKRFIYNRVKNNEVTNDLLQEVFIKIHLNIHKIKKQESIKSWIYTISTNTINDYFNKQAKQNKLSSKTIEIDNKTTTEHSAKDCLLPLINNLPSTYKDALLLSEINGLKQAEVAKILNISLSGAKSRIQRGRNMLKDGFIACCDYKLNKSGHLVGEHKEKKDCKVCN